MKCKIKVLCFILSIVSSSLFALSDEALLTLKKIRENNGMNTENESEIASSKLYIIERQALRKKALKAGIRREVAVAVVGEPIREDVYNELSVMHYENQRIFLKNNQVYGWLGFYGVGDFEPVYVDEDYLLEDHYVKLPDNLPFPEEIKFIEPYDLSKSNYLPEPAYGTNYNVSNNSYSYNNVPAYVYVPVPSYYYYGHYRHRHHRSHHGAPPPPPNGYASYSTPPSPPPQQNYGGNTSPGGSSNGSQSQHSFMRKPESHNFYSKNQSQPQRNTNANAEDKRVFKRVYKKR